CGRGADRADDDGARNHRTGPPRQQRRADYSHGRGRDRAAEIGDHGRGNVEALGSVRGQPRCGRHVESARPTVAVDPECQRRQRRERPATRNPRATCRWVASTWAPSKKLATTNTAKYVAAPALPVTASMIASSTVPLTSDMRSAWRRLAVATLRSLLRPHGDAALLDHRESRPGR